MPPSISDRCCLRQPHTVGHADGIAKRLPRRRGRRAGAKPHGLRFHPLWPAHEAGERGSVSALRAGEDRGRSRSLSTRYRPPRVTGLIRLRRLRYGREL